MLAEEMRHDMPLFTFPFNDSAKDLGLVVMIVNKN